MTDNIQELYEVVGVEKKPVYSGSQLYNPFITGYEYPPFTPEKQLELIKLIQLLDNIDSLQMFHHELNNKWCFTVKMLPEFSNIPTEILFCSHEEFEQGLANLIIDLWQDLSDDQKQEIKEILK